VENTRKMTSTRNLLFMLIINELVEVIMRHLVCKYSINKQQDVKIQCYKYKLSMIFCLHDKNNKTLGRFEFAYKNIKRVWILY
jgi:hypothetical protein